MSGWTSAARPRTQQPVLEHLWNSWLKALPPLPAVTPVARLSSSFSATCPSLLSSAVSVTDSPAAIVNMK